MTDQFYKRMRDYRAGRLRVKPRVPYQHGPHINSMPVEANKPAPIDHGLSVHVPPAPRQPVARWKVTLLIYLVLFLVGVLGALLRYIGY